MTSGITISENETIKQNIVTSQEKYRHPTKCFIVWAEQCPAGAVFAVLVHFLTRSLATDVLSPSHTLNGLHRIVPESFSLQ